MCWVLLDTMQNTINAESCVNATVRLNGNQTDLAVSAQIVRNAEAAERRVSDADKPVLCYWRGKEARIKVCADQLKTQDLYCRR